MHQSVSTGKVEIPSLETLEPRLLLSTFPVILEEPLAHSTPATAQDVTAQLTRLEAGDDSFGVRIEGTFNPHADAAGRPDYYRVDLPQEAVLAARVETSDSLRAEYSATRLSDQTTIFQDSDYGSTPWGYGPGDAGTYVFKVEPLSTGYDGADYTFILTVTYPQDLNWTVPPHDLGTRVADPVWLDFKNDNPLDAFKIPDHPGEGLELLKGRSRVDFHTGSWSTGYNGIGQEVYAAVQKSAGLIWSQCYGLFRLSTGVDLGEPNNTAAEAIDVTAYLQDAVADHPFADKILLIAGTHEDGTDDWYKLALDRPYVYDEWEGSSLVDEGGEYYREFREVVGPGVYYIHATNGGPFALEFQEADDGGGFQPVAGSPGLWKARVITDGPHEKQVVAIPTPVDLFVHESYFSQQYDDVGGYNVASDGFAYATVLRTPDPQKNPVEVYGYEYTTEAGSTALPVNAQSVSLLPREGNPHQLMGFAELYQNPGEEDWFTFELPWRATASATAHSRSPVILDTEGDPVSNVLEPGTYYVKFEADNWVYANYLKVAATRVIDLDGGADIASATDLDPHFSPTAGRRASGWRIPTAGSASPRRPARRSMPAETRRSST